jgi:two-component system, NtrC family, sensor histidine kinase GlrK
MAFYRPKSFVTLLFLGFAVGLAPLILALLNAEWALGRLSRQGASAVYRSVGATQGSRILLEKVIALERRARQFEVLGDPHLLEEAALTHEEIQQALAQLLSLPLEEEQKNKMAQLQKGENELFAVLTQSPQGSDEQKGALQRFAALNELATSIHDESRDLIFREVEAMRQATAAAQKTLFWQGAALVPFTLAVLAIFIPLLSKPVRQIDQAIHRLGVGDFEAGIVVQGPADLQFLGERLDWLRTQLAEAERTKDKFVAQVSHELKTPLASIREGAELLAEGVAGPLTDQQQEISAILCKSSVQLQKLIENLLSFSKSQASISPLYLTDLPLADLVEEVLADHQAVLLKKRVRLERQLDPLVCRGDRERLRTVVDNLVSNAAKYTPLGGVLQVKLKATPAGLALEVADSGPGVPEAEREQIFEPFFQGSRPAPGPIKGTGLGLSIAREFVDAHGGTLELVEAGQRGARFRVTLPQASLKDVS